MKDIKDANKNNLIIGIVSGVAILSIVGLFAFVVNVSQSISSIQAGQNEVNNAIINRLESLEDSFKSYAQGQENRWQGLSSDLTNRTENRYTVIDADKDHEISTLEREKGDLELKLWVMDNYKQKE